MCACTWAHFVDACTCVYICACVCAMFHWVFVRPGLLMMLITIIGITMVVEYLLVFLV